MRVFVTGASGFIGSAVVPELLSAGHEVLGLARSAASASALGVLGAKVHRGHLGDLECLRAGAAASDAVIHLAFIHDFSDFEASLRTDRQAIETLGTALLDSGKPLLIASGVLGLRPGRLVTEEDGPDPALPEFPRFASARLALSFASRGVKPSVVRLAPSVHGAGDHGFVARLVAIARDKGVSGYIGEGQNRWPAAHRLDIARLFRLGVEKAPSGVSLHGISEEGVRIRDIAEVIGRHLKLPVASVAQEEAAQHFGFLAGFLGLDAPASNVLTRKLLDWKPTHQGLLADLEQGHYFSAKG